MNPTRDATFDEVLEMLESDLISHGFFAQCVRGPSSSELSIDVPTLKLLRELLGSGKVEIGETEISSSNYVAFVAWSGSVEERVSRAVKAVDIATGHDKEFAYWLCLPKNVDRFED